MKILDCRPLAKEWEAKIKADTESYSASRRPCLLVITDGTDPASQVYIRQKVNAGERCNINVIVYKVHAQEELFAAVTRANSDDSIDGIIIQQPCLNLSFQELRDLVRPDKDVDGFNRNSDYYPCTPDGIINLLHLFDYNPRGKHCVVIGRSEIVGKPLARMLLDQNASVSVIHSKTPDHIRQVLLQNADMVFCCVGHPGLIKPTDVKDDAVIVDVGITRLDNGKICGDAGPTDVWTDTNVALTPVPGGVGPMTVTMLMAHTCTSWKRWHD